MENLFRFRDLGLKSLIASIIYLSLFMPLANAQWSWARGAGDDVAMGNRVAVDHSGNVYVAGVFSSATIAFGSGTLINASAGTKDLFLVKYDAGGNVLWAQRAGGIKDDYVNAITFDNADNVLIAGYFTSPTITFGTSTFNNWGYTTLYLTKYDASGNVIWSKSCDTSMNHPGNAESYITGVVTDRQGNVLVSTYFVGQMVIEGDTLATSLYDRYASLVLKFSSSGSLIRANSIHSEMYSFLTLSSISLDTCGNLYVAGSTDGNMIYADPIAMSESCANWKHFIIKLDSTGSGKWIKPFCSFDFFTLVPYYVCAFSPNQIYVTGQFGNTNDSIIIFGVDTIKTYQSGTSDIFLAKYDSTGKDVWIKKAGGNNADAPGSLFTDKAGNVYVTGTFTSSNITFDTTTLTNNATSNFFIAKYDSSGGVLWAKNANCAGDNYGNGGTVNDSGAVYMTGAFLSDSIVFGASVLLNNYPGNDALFLAKYDQGFLYQQIFPTNKKALVFPNPLNGNEVLNIILPDGSKYKQLNLFNSFGVKVYSTDLLGASTRVQLLLPHLNSGVYVLKFVREMECLVIPIIVAK